MQKKLTLMCAAMALTIAACSEMTPTQTGGESDMSASIGLTEIVNFERKNEGLSPLKSNAKLEAAAETLASDMEANNFLGHTGSDGSTLKDRVSAAGYCGRTMAENAYRGNGGALAAIEWWMNSPPHRANILNTKMSEFGMVGVGKSWVMVLAGRPC